MFKHERLNLKHLNRQSCVRASNWLRLFPWRRSELKF